MIIGRAIVIAAAAFLAPLRPEAGVAVAPISTRSTCAALDDESRATISSLLEEAFPPADVPTCGLYVSRLPLLRPHRDEVVPCLLEVHRRGLAGTGLWSRSDGPPDARRWAADAIGGIDPIVAIRLHAKDAAGAADRWERLTLRLRMLALGDASSSPAIVAILGDVDPASLRPHGRETARETQVVEAMAALVRRDTRDLLPALRAVRSVIGEDRRYLDVWVAQLERDRPALERFARNGSTWGFAFDSLARIGAWDLLRQFAADPAVYGQSKAQMLLEKGLPPLPPPLDAASPCRRVDSAGRGELAGWLDEMFPSPGYGGSECGPQPPIALRRQADAAAACIEDLHHHGLVGSGLWDRAEPEPYGGTWALGLLGGLDPTRAARLWREWRDEAGRDVWQRASADLARLHLDDRDALLGVIGFLRQPPDVPSGYQQMFRSLVENSAWEHIRIDHRPARTLLQGWRDRGFLQTTGFEIGIAKLARDAPTLERLARESQSTMVIEALGSIGATDALRRLADDPNYPYRGLAEGQLRSRR